jgi:hypothetical protein
MEAGGVELRHQIALIDQDLAPDSTEQPREREVQIRRLTQLHHVDPLAQADLQGKGNGGKERSSVFDHIPEPVRGIRRAGVFDETKTGNAPIDLVALVAPGDHRDSVPTFQKGIDLLAQTRVDAERDVLDDRQ